MISKEELIGILKKACEVEEKAIPIYTKHLESAVFWTGISRDDALKAREILRRLARESKSHKIIVTRIIEKLEKD